MKILVTGGTGTVGSQVVRELLARKADVSVLTRDAKKPLPPGATAVVGNLLEVASVRRVFNGIDEVFLLNPVSQTEATEALMAVTAMRTAGVKRVVYLSVHHADQAPWLPHFGSKVAVEAALKKSGMAWTILRPNNFFQNDYWFKDALLQYGVYPQPLGSVGLARVDVRDIAEAAAIALTQPGHEAQTYDLVGPTSETGESTAKVWSTVLGKPIAYAGDDLQAWAKQQLQYLPDWQVFDFGEMYAFFQQHGLTASNEAIGRQTRMLGHAPRAFEAFASETAKGWLQGR
ncbi:MAG TPA: NmrA family NAD(P)-binding protein [Vicinamibacterales bacterium]|nr:NmrA family NAD(P)-binding protein [Vicinamibacterales bacterium]